MSVGEWYGGGISKRPWPDHELIDTNIGTIKIINQTPNSNDLFTIEFKGYGLPQGPLAAEMGLSE